MSAAGNASPVPPVPVRVWTMSTAGLTEAAVAPWAAVLDAGERARAARFVFPHSRIAFIAAHALARAALAAAAGAPAAAFGFAAGARGKPEALLDGHPAGLAFNLSHTDGLVGVAVAALPGLPLGFDLEPAGRRAPMEVARRYFNATEIAWLDTLPETARTEGFFRLWTLKEAFIKATGKGLAQDLSSFWFRVDPPEIGFAPGLAGQPRDWWFDQRVVHGSFLAAIGLCGHGASTGAVWREPDPAGFDPAAGLVW
jgi:4'-phosphopantetheinyl transferase